VLTDTAVEGQGASNSGSLRFLGRLSEGDPNVDINDQQSRITCECLTGYRDRFGQLNTITQDADGNSATTADQRVEAYLYNARHQLIAKSSPEGVIHYEYNDLGQQTRTYTTATLASSTVLTDTRYTFDNYGRMKTVESWASAGVTHAAPQITTYVYDLIGRLSEQDERPLKKVEWTWAFSQTVGEPAACASTHQSPPQL
jgi:YD repeat-containing protein